MGLQQAHLLQQQCRKGSALGCCFNQSVLHHHSRSAKLYAARVADTDYENNVMLYTRLCKHAGTIRIYSCYEHAVTGFEPTCGSVLYKAGHHPLHAPQSLPHDYAGLDHRISISLTHSLSSLSAFWQQNTCCAAIINACWQQNACCADYLQCGNIPACFAGLCPILRRSC